MQNISVIVITKNEENNIERCLKSAIQIASEIVVVDSLSTDKTIEIVKKYTDKVFINPWPGFSEQKEFALSKTIFDWVLWIDADEEISQDLASEIRCLDYTKDGYLIPRLVYYMGRWIRHCGWYPDYTLRLFKKNKGHFSDVLVHESFILSGNAGKLKSPIFHYPYRNISHHIEKMNTYTTLFSQQMLNSGKKTSVISAIFHAIFRFIKMYFLKCGFLDGSQGIVVCVLGSYYVFLKYVKLVELIRMMKLRSNVA